MTSLISNMFLNGLFVGGALYFGFVAPHAGMSLASAIAGYLNAGLLLYWLRKDNVFKAQPGWLAFGVQLLVAAITLSMVFAYGLWHAQHWIGAWGAASAKLRFAALLSVIGVGGVVYLATLWLCGLNPRKMLDRHEPAPNVRNDS
jgi:putative peptidoglycan lipid II flippase